MLKEGKPVFHNFIGMVGLGVLYIENKSFVFSFQDNA